jgi:uncharacterized membrane protein YgdD (TMEM256/DUF423 family)
MLEDGIFEIDIEFPASAGMGFKMNKWIKIGGLLGFLGVVLGAFGAHAFKSAMTQDMIEIYKTGVLYHLIHSIVILGIGFYADSRFNKAAIFFMIGIILFSFSLYLLAITSISWLGIITPFGGISFLIGWGLVIYGGFKK